jgi:hypothetical protein
VRGIELLRVIIPKFDGTRKLHSFRAVSQAESSGLSVRLGKGLRVAQQTEFPIGSEIPFLSRDEVNAHGVRESGLRPAVLITFFDVDAGTVGEPFLHARSQVALTDLESVVCPLVFQRIVHVKAGPFGIQESRSDLPAEPEVPVGAFAVEPEAFRQTIGATQAVTPVALTIAGGRPYRCDGIPDRRLVEQKK